MSGCFYECMNDAKDEAIGGNSVYNKSVWISLGFVCF